MSNLTSGQQERINNIRVIQSSVALIGSIGGVIYANKTGGKWYRYIGYWVLGGLVLGVPSALIATPFVNKIIKESEQKQSK